MVTTPAAGAKVRALDEASWIWQTLEAVASASIVVTTALQDVPSATITTTPLVTNTVVVAIGVFYCDTNGATDYFTGHLDVDAVDQTAQAIFHQSGAALANATVMQTWRFTLATAAPHTIKLRVLKLNVTNTVDCVLTHTKLTIMGNGLT